MSEEKKEFSGISAYPGIIYGKIKKIKNLEPSAFKIDTDLPQEERAKELEKFHDACQNTKKQLEKLVLDVSGIAGMMDLVEILSTQIQILEDPEFQNLITTRIQEKGENACLAVETTVQILMDRFHQLEDEFFKERSDQIQDVGKRLIRNLTTSNDKKNNHPFDLNQPCILVAKDLSPSELLTMDRSKILGIATDFGGKTGHMAIIARNYGIPTIVGLKNLSTYVEDGEFILLNADKGFVKRDPSWEEYKYYGERCSIPNEKVHSNKKELKTLDGTSITLKVNLETHNDCLLALQKKPDGVGLYRSEILFLQFPDHNPSEDEQFYIYKLILESMKGLPVTIRVFDIGADKLELGVVEDNPFLGNRGIRYLLRHKNFFKEQIRALQRASIFGKLQILIPMVTTVQEVIQTHSIINEVRKELTLEGIPYEENIPLGIMVETPACALGLENFLPLVDFISVGTNDLLQYTMAVARNNFSVSDLYNPYHIVFLEIMEQIAKISQKKKVPASICGELAADAPMVGLLIAMGFREFSVSPPFLDLIRSKIQSTKLKEEKNKLKKIKNLSKQERYLEIEGLLKFNQ